MDANGKQDRHTESGQQHSDADCKVWHNLVHVHVHWSNKVPL
jgi:hypothetical protein